MNKIILLVKKNSFKRELVCEKLQLIETKNTEAISS